MPERMIVDLLVMAAGALVFALGPARAQTLGDRMFLAGLLAALFAQR